MDVQGLASIGCAGTPTLRKHSLRKRRSSPARGVAVVAVVAEVLAAGEQEEGLMPLHESMVST
jgi:hypothetical protein